MKKTKETTDFYRIASEFYLCAPLPQDYEEMDCDEFNDFLEEHAFEPFEHWNGDDINGCIEGLSYKMEQIAGEARKNTLDEVRAALNIQ
jgi:hypothetical protein